MTPMTLQRPWCSCDVYDGQLVWQQFAACSLDCSASASYSAHSLEASKLKAVQVLCRN